MGRIIFVNRFYWPDHAATGQLLTDLSRALARTGAAVTVITSRPPAASQAHEHVDGVEIIRIASSRSASASLAGKALDFLTFYLAALWHMARQVHRGDTLILLTDPPLLGIAAAVLAGVKRARLVHWVHDIYPEVAEAVTGRRALRLLRAPRNWAWRRAVRCVTIGDDMAGVLRAAGVRPGAIAVIPNWAPAGLYPVTRDDPEVRALRQSWDVADRFVVAYSGNLGRVHQLSPIIEAAEALRDVTHVVFLFVGSGAQEGAIRDAVRVRALDNVRFIPAQPRDQLARSLGAADLHLVTLRPECERFVFPSKLYGIAAVGRPVVFVGPAHCEPARAIAQAGIGKSVTDGAALAATIRELSGSPGAYATLAAAAQRQSDGLGSTESSLRAWRDVLAAVSAC